MKYWHGLKKYPIEELTITVPAGTTIEQLLDGIRLALPDFAYTSQEGHKKDRAYFTEKYNLFCRIIGYNS
jgi:hypothetical protein